jgi:acyl-CoA thioester hydrolase
VPYDSVKPPSETDVIEAPVRLYREKVDPAWIDRNDHVGVNGYARALLRASGAVLRYTRLGFKDGLPEGRSVYAVKWATTYLREIRAGATLEYTFQLLDYSDKLVHYAIFMHNADENYVAAISESLDVHILTATRRSAVMPPDRMALLGRIWEVHKAMPMPPEVSAAIAIRSGGRRQSR